RVVLRGHVPSDVVPRAAVLEHGLCRRGAREDAPQDRDGSPVPYPLLLPPRMSIHRDTIAAVTQHILKQPKVLRCHIVRAFGRVTYRERRLFAEPFLEVRAAALDEVPRELPNWQLLVFGRVKRGVKESEQ